MDSFAKTDKGLTSYEIYHRVISPLPYIFRDYFSNRWDICQNTLFGIANVIFIWKSVQLNTSFPCNDVSPNRSVDFCFEKSACWMNKIVTTVAHVQMISSASLNTVFNVISCVTFKIYYIKTITENIGSFNVVDQVCLMLISENDTCKGYFLRRILCFCNFTQYVQRVSLHKIQCISKRLIADIWSLANVCYIKARIDVWPMKVNLQ